jgi:hypothetical protein
MSNEGIITSKDGLTMPSLSIVIWISTLIIYNLIALVWGDKVDYVKCAFVTSLLLSIICGFTIINGMLKDSVQPTKLFLVIFNIVLLFSAANGYQAGYAFQDQREKTISGKEVPAIKEEKKLGFVIPFLDPRPWLPSVDKEAISGMQKQIDDLENQLGNARLREQKLIDSLIALQGKSGNSKSDIKKELEDYKQTIANLTAENQQLRNSQQQKPNDELNNEVVRLRNVNQQLVSEIERHNGQVISFINCSANGPVQKAYGLLRNNLKEFNCSPVLDSLLRIQLRTSF